MPDFLVAIAIFIYVILAIVFIIAWADIFSKAGYNRWLCFLMVIPVVNIVVFIWFAFSKWPVYEFVQKDWDIKKLRAKQKELEQQIQQIAKTQRHTVEPDDVGATPTSTTKDMSAADEPASHPDLLFWFGLSLLAIGIGVLLAILSQD